MNNKLLLIALAVVSFSSCSTIYKSGQTPDDVYYSPVRLGGETSRSETQNDERNYSQERSYSEDRQIRLGIYDYRWRNFDNDISYNPYRYGYNYGYYYNPYYYPFPVYNNNIIVVAAPNPKNSTPRMTNLAAYNGNYNNYNNGTNIKTGSPYKAPVRSYNNSNSSKLGKALRNVFSTDTPSGYNPNSGNSTQGTRSYSPSSSSGTRSSGSSGSSSGGSTSRPPRNGKG